MIPNLELSIQNSNALDKELKVSLYLKKYKRAVWVEICYAKECLLISLRNRYTGELKLRGSRLQSRKEEKGHGIGIFSMQKAATKLGGTMTIKDNDGFFSLEIWIPCS